MDAVYIIYHYEECDGRQVSDVVAVRSSESSAKKAVEEFTAEAEGMMSSDEFYGYEGWCVKE